ncbi:MAG: phosphotransferase [Chloroflexi bacterium]|nr:phosphotransferase [Chloroflexota bacterium]
MRPLGAGGWLATHALSVVQDARRHELVLRRWARPGWEREDPTFPPATEAAVLDRLAASAPDIPAPRVVALDTDGARAGVPAILATRLPGRPPSLPATRRPDVLRQLATWLVRIHGVDAGLEDIAHPFRSYSRLDEIAPPPGSGRPDLWARALAVAGSRPAARVSTFLHRDFHPGNTLWRAGRLTGIVDWTAASWGPPAADLAHLRGNLAIDHGPAVADLVERLYREAGGSTEHQRWWDIRTVLDYVPDLVAHPASGDALARLERYLEGVLQEV